MMMKKKKENKTAFTFNSVSFNACFLCLLERERGGGGGGGVGLTEGQRVKAVAESKERLLDWPME